ncbi:SRPBCC family protein [Cellulomonas composti]|uniref:Polyketide cyclase n=1 Tax=Cellulomonas composti TaxID=266130 RepID=A0A511JAR1_9CELL|nr:SRPBCC family protein [Cellulomonas composti]GEL95068.1 hypothetical protein CCO02nite_17260 [Cellulomonas composti]
MRPVHVTTRLPVGPDEAWLLLADARNHARWIPLTTVTADGPPASGVRVRAVSGPRVAGRRWGLVDRMTIVRAQPPSAGHPGVATFRKDGPVLLGSAQIAVRAAGAAGPGGVARVDAPSSCLVRWTETVHVRGPLPRVTHALLAVPIRAMVHLALRSVRRDLAQRIATESRDHATNRTQVRNGT